MKKKIKMDMGKRIKEINNIKKNIGLMHEVEKVYKTEKSRAINSFFNFE